MREGSLDAPTRHPIHWQDPDFYVEKKLYQELERVFDICHGCRRCFNLCDSFPRLFDMIDESTTGELDSVNQSGYQAVIDACTLCDMCFLTKCPYVPPHEFNLDFPHLMVRARAVAFKNGRVSKTEIANADTDKNGKLGSSMAGLANWATRRGNALTRPLLKALKDIHPKAELPEFAKQTCTRRAAAEPVEINTSAPAVGRKAVIYASCFGEYNDPDIVLDTRAVLARNGVQTEIVYPECCGMPQLEHGDLETVAAKAASIAATLRAFVDQGFDVVVPVASCALMLKFEWPLIASDDDNVKALAAATFDATEYVVDIAKKNGMAEGMTALEGSIVAHIACHARAQNMGRKAEEVLALIPQADVKIIERCSGHGGTWGVTTEFFEVGMKVGKPVFRQAAEAAPAYVISECPLARDHIVQGMEDHHKTPTQPGRVLRHPVQALARAYGL